MKRKEVNISCQAGGRGGGAVTPYKGLYGDTPLQRERILRVEL